MVKVFISVPMRGRTDEDIKSDIERAKEKVRSAMGDVEFANSFYGDDVESRECDAKKHPGLAYLGRSLKDMADCNIVFFCNGWEHARGCWLEKRAAKSYGLLSICEDE